MSDPVFRVMSERCAECLYGKDKIVSNERRAEILREIERKDTFFICHKSTIAGGPTVACRGDWDQRKCGRAGRLLEALGIVEMVKFVKEEEL
jgi:hypothetical protein